MTVFSRFDRDARTWDNPGRTALAEKIVSLVSERIKITDSMKVMDFGSGTGLVSLGLCPLSGKVVAVDASIEMLKVLNEKAAVQGISNIETIQTDILSDDLDGYRFDLIVSSMTLHHIADTESAMKKFYMLLNKNGHIAIADLDIEEGNFHSSNEGVKHFGFERDSLSSLMTSAGFSSVNFETAFVFKKEISEKVEKNFSVFLATAVK